MTRAEKEKYIAEKVKLLPDYVLDRVLHMIMLLI